MGLDFIRKVTGLTFLVVMAVLFYFSVVRFASQLVMTTDESSLWISDLQSGSGFCPKTIRFLAAIDPFSADYRYLLARGSMVSDLPEARAALAAGLRSSPADPKLWILSGWIESASGRFNEAMKNFERAVLLDPGRPDSYAQRGVFIAGMYPFLDGRKKPFYFSLAEENIILAVKLDPRILSNPHVALALSSIYREKGEDTKALTLIRKIDDVGPVDFAVLLCKWALQFDLGDAKGPVDEWNRLFTPNSRFASNVDLLEREIRKQHSPDFRYFLSQIHRYRGDKNGALSELVALTALRVHVPEYRLALASLYEEAGDRTEALKAYEEVLRLSPSNEQAKRQIIEYYKCP